jgi:hypothetical protein
LFLSKCKSLVELPARLGDCRRLALLELTHCKKLVRLPDSLRQADYLRALYCSHCLALEYVPPGLIAGAAVAATSVTNRIVLWDFSDCPVTVIPVSQTRPPSRKRKACDPNHDSDPAAAGVVGTTLRAAA